MIKVDTAKSDSINDILMDSSLFDHEFLHLLSVHVAGTTIGMGDDHDLLLLIHKWQPGGCAWLNQMG